MKKSIIRLWMTGLFLSMMVAPILTQAQGSGRANLNPPQNLIATVENDNDVTLVWEAPDTGGDPVWLHWDSGENFDAFGGFIGAIEFGAAGKWNPEHLSSYDGWKVTKIKFFVTNSNPTIDIKIWTGDDGVEQYSQNVPSFNDDDWTEIELDTPWEIDASTPLWAGLYIDMPFSGGVMGIDEGPAIAGQGDMILWEGTWYENSTWNGIDHNWNIQIEIQDVTGAREIVELLGYNVYRDSEQLNNDPVPSTSYVDQNLFNGIYEYYVTAVYDEGESDPSNTVEVTIDQPVILESDSLALVDLYNECNGVNWVSQDNWFETPLSEWEGVQTEDTRVVSFSSVFDNIEGDIPESFGDLTALTDLYLSGNPITSLPESFGNLESLNEAWMGETEISSLPDNFGDLDNLETLSISDLPNLTELPESFGDLEMLYWFGAGRNGLTALPSTFGNLSNLFQCYIDNNSITELPENFGNLSSLAYLGVEYNMLSTLPESFGDLPALISLNAMENSITQLPESFGNISTLERLDMPLNGLESLSDNFGDLESLQYLRLSINNLTELPASFSNLGSLERCFLDQNMLTTLPDDFGNLSNLWELSLSVNAITELPESIGDLDAMLVFFVVDNELSGLPDGIGGMEHVQFLGLGKNNIETVPESIGNLGALGYLDLSDNQINELPSSIGNLDADTLLLFSNHIPELPESMFDNNYTILWTENNALQFGSLEPFVGNVPSYIYSPQEKFGNDTIIYPASGGMVEYTLEVSGENNDYQWYKEGVMISGQTTNTLTLTDVTAEDEGVYTLEVTNTVVTDLTLVSRDVIVDVVVTDLEEFDESTFSIYPNPASGSTINLDSNISGSSYKVQILNTSGQIVSEENLTGNDSQINISNLSNGIYLLKVSSESGNHTMIKFIKN